MQFLNETHEPTLESWVVNSHPEQTDFPIQNLPFGRFILGGENYPRLGVAIGSSIFDLGLAAKSLLFSDLSEGVTAACGATFLNPLMALSTGELSALRLRLSKLLRTNSAEQKIASACLHPMEEAQMCLPADVRNFSDFFTSIFHATNSGKMSRPDAPLLPNFHHLPVAYHGRASTLCVSGTSLNRPRGQFLPQGAADPVYEPTQKMDFECELAIHIGRGNQRGEEILLSEAAEHIFGVSLLNDWSARDVQRWEAQPLGPFLAKSSLTTISPWIVTMEALAPYRVPAAVRGDDVPQLLPHLNTSSDQQAGGLDIHMEVYIRTAAERHRRVEGTRISTPRFRSQYWTIAQMLTHQTSNGCKVEAGDILGSGTVSGPTDDELGCLLELTKGGTQPISLNNGEQRTWLHDGDDVVLHASCSAKHAVRIGFGECSGTVLPPRP